MARKSRKGRAQYSNRTAIPGAELATPAPTVTSANTSRQPSQHTSSHTRAASNGPKSSAGPTRGHQGPARPLTPASDKSSSPSAWSASNGQARPLTPPASPPRLARNVSFGNPWELPGFEYPRPERRSGLLSFEWPRTWLSFEGKQANEELRKELIAHRQFTLPLPLPSTYVAPVQMKELDAENNKIRNIYHKLGQGHLFNIRMKNRNVQYDSSLIFSSRLPSLNEMDKHSWSSRNLPRPGNHAGYVAKPNFFNIVETTDVWTMVLDYLKHSIRDVSAVAMTCKSVAVATRSQFDVWRFEDAEFDIDNFITKRENGRLIQRHGIRWNTLLLTGGRQAETSRPYSDALECMFKLCYAVRVIPFSFRDVVLHRIPFLDIQMLALLVKAMPNLETLSISSCLLLDAAKLPRILDIIRRNRRITEGGEQSYIKVDFAPYRFFGPQTLNRAGTFIITHHVPDFDIPKAATALLYRCLPDAKKVGMDLLSDSSSFWHFFRQLPGPCPLWAVKVREAIVTQERHKPQSDAYLRALDNLCAAVSGDNRSPEELPPRRFDRNYGSFRKGRMPYNYWRTEKACPNCKTTLSHCLFVNCAPDNSNGGKPRCWGCHMILFVANYDHSHFRERQHSILRHIFQRPPPRPRPKRTNANTTGANANTTGANANTTGANGDTTDANADTTDANAGTGTDADAGADSGAVANGVDHGDSKANDGADQNVAQSVKDTAAANEGIVNDYHDDDGIFDKALFSVKSLTDPLDLHQARPKNSTEFFTYKTVNFMAQNIGCARSLARDTDKAWKHYRRLEHDIYHMVDWNTTEKLPAPKNLTHYRELVPGECETFAGSVCRWMRYYNPPTGPCDYLYGGPQYRNPFKEMSNPPIPLKEPGKLNLDQFAREWYPHHAFFKYRIRKPHLDYLASNNGTGLDLFQFARGHVLVRSDWDKRVESEWKAQHEQDWHEHYISHAWYEDAHFSLCAPGRVIYNNDLRRLKIDRDNAQWDLDSYCTGKHRF
ncbi:hypothetical protein V8F20_000624 [Naviculisporaceae sp. PSN 640]